MDQSYATIDREISRLVWDESTVIEQAKLVKSFKNAKQTLPITEVGRLENSFQRKLRITKDQWLRLLIVTDTERLKSLRLIWEVNKLPSQAPAYMAGSSLYPKGGWLGEYLHDYCRVMESPDSFIFWSGVAALSAVIRRKVWLRFGTMTLYPNTYCILVSRAGMARKGPPIKAAEMFARTIPDVSVLGRTTTERFAHDLSYAMVAPPGGGAPQRVSRDAHGFICAEELVTFLSGEHYSAGILGFLIEWWDCQDKKEVRTLKHGVIELNNLHITLLGGTTPDWLSGQLSSIVAGGGMLSRTIFVVEERTPKMIPMPMPADENSKRRLIEQIAYINGVAGEFSITDEALKYNDQWYVAFRKTLENNENDAPALERNQVHMLKLAMVLALSEGKPLIVTDELLDRASNLMKEIEKGVPDLTRALLATPLGKEQLRVLSQIKKAGGVIDHSDLLRRNSPYGIDKDALKKIVETLEDQDVITIHRGKKTEYRIK